MQKWGEVRQGEVRKKTQISKAAVTQIRNLLVSKELR